jgi:hypothetical protein
MSQCPPGQYFSFPDSKCKPFGSGTGTGTGTQQPGTQQPGTKFNETYFGGLLSGILGNLSLGFGQGAGQSLNPQQPQVIQQPARDNTILIVIIAVVVVGIVILMNRRPIEK